MASPDKAQIAFMVGEGEDAKESILRFHSVITEEHEISSEVTKFPVQSGFSISNHAIKKNRKVTISGAISNHLIVGSEEFHEYGGSNTRIVFGTLKALVREATPCEVLTNFSTYTPVIFTKFKTKLQAGKTDVMEFTMTGEEVQLATTVNQTTPTLLVFTPLSDEEREARVDELLSIGLTVPEGATISEAKVDLNESFQTETKGANGETFITTYERSSYDPTSKTYYHKVHTSDTEVAEEASSDGINWYGMMQEEQALPDIDLEAGAATFSACLADGLVGLATDIAEEEISTSLGKLKQSIYGAAYEVFGVKGDESLGQVLLTLGLDCLVAGTIGTVNNDITSDVYQDSTIPTIDQMVEGAASIGDSIVNETLGIAAPTTITKISSTGGSTSFFGDLL